ncbi:MAG: MarR family winged helix-turn-helix transcriptional regulator [Verrucomicrobiota bacterium JB022]|nr:MarR family winged helix-turn-helix transcriptional regulator [Verrucomicrobiota bacterium JB022]
MPLEESVLSAQTLGLSDEQAQQAFIGCACFNLRKASRAMTQIYDDVLRPLNLRSGQFALLIGIRLLGRPTIQELADLTWLDRSALSRNLRPLEARGLLQIEPGKDRRTRRITLTEMGDEALCEGYERWQEAQVKTETLLGPQQLNGLLAQIGEVCGRLKPEQN